MQPVTTPREIPAAARQARIEREHWLRDAFARVRDGRFVDVLRYPHPDSELQTQLYPEEIHQLLGHREGYALVRKFCGTIGWVAAERIEPTPRRLPPPPAPAVSAEEFRRRWMGVPYRWGGVSESGIDCSGLTQRYFLDVRGQVIPKNSWDQRRSGHAVAREEARDGDLLFASRDIEHGRHHVGIVVGDRADRGGQGVRVLHAAFQRGVVEDPLSAFLERYRFEELIRVPPPLALRPARSSESGQVAGLLLEVSSWLHGRGIPQWLTPHPRERLEAEIQAGEVLVLEEAGEIIGTVTLTRVPDPYWPDAGADADAVYLHRLAVRRARAGQGIGREMVRWAERHLAESGVRRLRLDCMASSARMRAYYAALGYEPRGVGWDARYGMEFALFEKRLAE
jgi:RimJ/RimL family protein N-acetyltransferase